MPGTAGTAAEVLEAGGALEAGSVVEPGGMPEPGWRAAAVSSRRPKGASMESKRSASVTQTSAGRPFQYSAMLVFAMAHF